VVTHTAKGDIVSGYTRATWQRFVPRLLALAAPVSPARSGTLEAYPGIHGIAESQDRDGVIVPTGHE
jgi:hypothetical protein